MLGHHDNTTPKTGFAGLAENWRNDLISAFSVALVALPLGLVISMASNAPPMSGVLTAIVGGLITTFIRGSYMAINGPGNTLILLVASGVLLLNDYENGQIIPMSGFQHCLGAFIVAGGIQIIFGFLRIGKLAHLLPTSTVYGLLGAIGIMILGKQVHVALGVTPLTGTEFAPEYFTGIKPIDYLIEIPLSVSKANPIVALISLIGLLVLIFHSKIKNKFVHFIPAPIFVLVFTIPIVFLFNFFDEHTINFSGNEFVVSKAYLVNLPERVIDSIFFPRFDKIGDFRFWSFAISVALLSTIEGLSSAKAVEKLDPFRRRVKMNKDLIGLGASTIIAAFIGGLPVVTAIARSSVNINHGGKTMWSNFLHGLILLVIVLALTPWINMIPKAALASILIYTGYKLSAPKIFQDAIWKGKEQIIILLITYFSTLLLGLIAGLCIGILTTFIIQFIISKMNIGTFLAKSFKANISEINEKEGEHFVQIKGVSNFLNLLTLREILNNLPEKETVTVGFSNAKIVDHTVLEFAHDFEDKYVANGGKCSLVGLGVHHSSSSHPYALHYLSDSQKIEQKSLRLTNRQKGLMQICEDRNYTFEQGKNWDTDDFKDFLYFESKELEYTKDRISGAYDSGVPWFICDITFDDGVFTLYEQYHTTVQVIKLKKSLPEFVIEKEEFLDKFLSFAGYEEVDLKIMTHFSSKFVVKAHDDKATKAFLTPELILFFENHEIYHLECKRDEIIVFKYMRLATPAEILKMIEFNEELVLKLGE